MTYPAFADVAELADAQVSEACDGDIVEVQVLSSAPKQNPPKVRTEDRSHGTYLFFLKIIVTNFRRLVFW